MKKLFVFLSFLALASCASRFADADSLVRKETKYLKDGNFQAALSLMTETAKYQVSTNKLREINDYFQTGEATHFTLIRKEEVFEHGMNRAKLLYQIMFSDRFGSLLEEYAHVYAEVDFRVDGEFIAVYNVNNSPEMPPMPENKFSLFGKSLKHYVFLLIMLLIPVMVIATLLYALISKIEYKPMWAVIISVALVKITLNWETAKITLSPIGALLFGIGFRQEAGGVWDLSIALPIGALVFLLFRKRFLKKK